MTSIQLNRCENCKLPSGQLAVVDGVLTCPTCITKSRDNFYATLFEMHEEEQRFPIKINRRRKR